MEAEINRSLIRATSFRQAARFSGFFNNGAAVCLVWLDRGTGIDWYAGTGLRRCDECSCPIARTVRIQLNVVDAIQFSFTRRLADFLESTVPVLRDQRREPVSDQGEV